MHCAKPFVAGVFSPVPMASWAGACRGLVLARNLLNT
jgi:hypothetical protein